MTVPTDDDLNARAARVLAGGATHVARSYRPAIHVERARGARKWLVDGRELVDYTMGHGALLLGHAHPAVVEAVDRQLHEGTHFGAGSRLEVEWAERIAAAVPSVDRVRFTSSGTEATMLALRLARAATGRDIVAKVAEHFHGWGDSVVAGLGPAGAPLLPSGVPGAVGETVLVLPSLAPEVVAAALRAGDVAALILEASGARFGWLPLPPEHVLEAARLCGEAGTLLVVDEVVTGFRVGRDGMQGRLGVRADLSAFAKVVAGGLPGGAVGGRADVMDLLAVPDDETGERFVSHPGTFNANPLSAAAGIAALDAIESLGARTRAEAFAAALEEAWGGEIAAAGLGGRVWRLSSIVHLSLDDPAADARLGIRMREEGVDCLRTSAFCSAVHGDADLERSVAALRRALPRSVSVGA
ncbi:MAG: aminotransferase class III-fold pyridoxal phosphate-dependent enzyme [Chloroflexi bacterium]|nr:MAG: aminotransferase class III-fold pyridoxal phosphate-dependent enzyme [Chloroflexota bacterium]